MHRSMCLCVPTFVFEMYQSQSVLREQWTLLWSWALVCSVSSSSSPSTATTVSINLSRTLFIKCFSAEMIKQYRAEHTNMYFKLQMHQLKWILNSLPPHSLAWTETTWGVTDCCRRSDRLWKVMSWSGTFTPTTESWSRRSNWAEHKINSSY